MDEYYSVRFLKVGAAEKSITVMYTASIHAYAIKRSLHLRLMVKRISIEVVPAQLIKNFLTGRQVCRTLYLNNRW
jgi:hypothetical protein